MLYMFKLIGDALTIFSASGLTAHEAGLAARDGWTLYMTTDRAARADAERIAAGHSRPYGPYLAAA